MSFRRLASLTLPALLLFALYGGCSDSDAPAEASSSAGASPGGTSSSAGAAGVPSKAGAAGASAGKGGAGGKAGAAGSGGASGGNGGNAAPEWKEVGTVRGAPIARLLNPEKHQLFEWEACDWTPDASCEEAHFENGLAPLSEFGGILSFPHDDGTEVRVGTLVTRTEVASVTDEEGHVQEAFTNFGDGYAYSFSLMKVHGKRFSFPVYQKENPAPGGVIGTIGEESLLLFEPKYPTEKPYLYGSPAQNAWLGPKRWAWWLGQTAMVSWDNDKAYPVGIFSLTVGDDPDKPSAILGLIDVNDLFVLNERRTVDGVLRPMLVLSDGVKKAEPFFPLPFDAADASPIFTNTHLVWFRGFGLAGDTFDKVEVWALKWGAQGAEGEPYKLLDHLTKSNSFGSRFLAGGHGWAVHSRWTKTPEPGDSPWGARLIHVPSAKSAQVQLPAGIELVYLTGVTRTHLWMMVEKKEGYYPPRFLIRWKLPPLESLQ